jgi:hypothetical protein
MLDIATKKGGEIAQWMCRICGYERYYQVVVSKGNNQYYRTQFYACSSCRVMFHCPASFNAHNTEPVVDVRPSQEFRIRSNK